MTDEQKSRLLFLTSQMRQIAQAVGCQHSYWDIISDVEAAIEGKPTIIKQTPEEWISYCENELSKHEQQT